MHNRAAILLALASFGAGAGWIIGCGGDTFGAGIPKDASADGDGSEGGGAEDAGPKTCEQRDEEVDRLRALAIACDPRVSATQCGFLVEDVCCKTSVTDPTSDAVKTFERAARKYVADCNPICIECQDDRPSKICNPTSSGGICKNVDSP